MSDDSLSDPFRPPEEPVEVSCIHCGQTYTSDRIEWRMRTGADGSPHGFWCCPIPGCDGIGFGFDILPTDPTYRDERGGWFDDEYDEEDEFDDDDEDDDFEEEFDDEFEDGDDFDPADLDEAGPLNPPPPRPHGSNGNGNGRKYDFPNDDIPF